MFGSARDKHFSLVDSCLSRCLPSSWARVERGSSPDALRPGEGVRKGAAVPSAASALGLGAPRLSHSMLAFTRARGAQFARLFEGPDVENRLRDLLNDQAATASFAGWGP